MKSRYLTVKVLLVSALTGLLFGCAGLPIQTGEYNPSYPEVKIAVFSDPHFYSTALGDAGSAIDSYLKEDRKLLLESAEIIDTALAMVLEKKPDILIIPGDLTKDGERVNHEAMAGRLSLLADSGIKVIVVPGNHDIMNPHAFRYSGDKKEPVDSVTPEEFARIYDRAGYGSAIRRDPASLSYVAEPVEGLWILALDACEYEKNVKRDSPFTGGKFSHAQINWIRDTLAWGIKQNKVMLAVMHHGVVEHYNSQKKHFRDYLVRSNVQVARILASGKVPLVFTGHYHAQDIALTKFKNGTYLYDVETGSLVTYPDPLRLVTLESSGKAVISSFNVTEIPSFTAAGRDFADYSKSNVRSGINGIAVATMIKFGMKEPEAAMLAPQITEAFIAHYSGDERFTGKEMLATGGLSFMGGLVVGNRKDLVYGLWQDSEPPDNSLIIDFTSGSWFSP